MTTPVKSNQQHIFIHDAICEGPVEGLLYGESSVYLNNNRARPLNPDAPYAPLNGKIEFTSTSDTTGSLSSNIPGKYVGTPNNTNYLVIRGGSIEKSGTPVNNSGVFTITGDASFTSAYTTEDNLNKVIALVSTDESNQVYLLGEGKLNGTKLTFTPLNPQYDTAIIVQNQDYKVQLLETLEILSIAVDSIEVTSGPSLGANGSSPYTYYISGSIQPDAEDTDADAPSVQKVKVQFRNGSTIQDPIVELNGVGGGSSYTGNPQDAIPQQLKQLNVAAWNAAQSGTPANKVPKSDTPAGNPFPNYGGGNYPEGESIATEGAISPTIITATDFGIAESSIPLLDEVRISISYNSLYAVSKKDGKETTNTAIYLFQIRKKAPGASTFNEWQNAFNDGGDTTVGQINHTAKNKSAISFEHFIDLDFIKPFEDFEIRITRLTRHKGRACLSQGQDAGDDQELEGSDSTSFISNITAINRDKFSYPHTAHAGIFLDSREYSSVPKRSYEMRGMRVHVPNGYIPRDYSSTGDAAYPDFWDGTMSQSRFYTNNPAWVFYDIVVNDRFGAGEWIKEDDVDLYALYRISKYCDELVDDGKGGTEPRFTANLYLSKATDVYKVLKDMATIFTSLIYWMDGKMTTILDAPGDPVYNFSRANVIDGAFSYETTGQKTKTNQVVVTWNDPELNYEQSTLVIEDRASIVREGRIIKENAFAFGCTSEGQAQRYGKWKLFTAQGQTEVISFRTSLEGAFIRPGDIIQVQDTARYGAKFSGRIASATSTNVTLDRPVTLGSSTYELSVIITEPAAFYVGDGTINIRNAADNANEETYTRGERVTRAWVDDNNNGTRTLQTVDTEAKASNAWTKETGGEFLPTTWKEDSYVESKSISNNQSDVTSLTASFSTTPTANSIWVITETESGTPTAGSADLYKVLSIAQDDKNIYSISAVEHTNDKYAYVDNPDSILDLPNDVFPTEPEFAVAPTQIRVLQTSDASRPDEELQIEWDYPALVDVGAGELQETTRYLDGFEIVHNVPGIESPVNAGKRARNYTFTNVPDGNYFFRVQAISISGKRSDWITARYLVDDPFSDNVNRIKGLQTEGLTTHFPYITNQTGILGAIRGAYDTTGSVTYSTNDVVTDGGQSYYLSGSDTNVGHVSVSADNTATPGTWTEYSAGILKFNDSGENVVLAPSKFRSDETVSLTSGYTLDCSAINSLGTNFPGIPGGNPRVAYVVLDHGSSALKLIKADFDEALNLFYWQDLSVYDPTDTNAVWSALTGTATVAAGSNKVVGTGTTFTSLNNLNKLKFSTTGSSITPSGITWSSGIATVSATGHGLVVGDIITISGANPEGYNEYTVTISSVASDGNSFTYSIGTDPGTYVSGASITPYTFYEAARVAYVESDTVLYLNRKLDQDTQFSGTVRVQEYAPDFRRDVIIGQVLYNTTNGNYRFKNFLTLDPNLTAGRSVFLDSNVAFIQFDLQATPEPILLPEEIIVDAIATGYEQPLFKITYNNGDTVFEEEDTEYNAPPPGSNPFKYEKTIYTYDENNLPTYSATPYEIQVDVIEGKDPGNSGKHSTDIFEIPMVEDVAAGTGAKFVNLQLEDYTVIYDKNGANPNFNGVDSNITLTAVASEGFGDPLFQWSIGGVVVQSWYDPGAQSGSYDYAVPTTVGIAGSYTWDNESGGSKTVKIEVAEKPANWDPADNSTDPSASEAEDSDNILAVRVGSGGIAISLTNDSHVVPCDKDGDPKTFANSGTNIEVFSGGVPLDFVTTLPSTRVVGQWTVSASPSWNTGSTQVGAITSGGTSPERYAIVDDHTFEGEVGNGLDNTETVTYTIVIPQEADTGAADLSLTRIQTFSLGLDGQDSTTAGASGTDARSIKLSANQYVIKYTKTGGESDTIDFTTEIQGVEDTAYYVFSVDGVQTQPASGDPLTTSTFTLPDADEPAVNGAPVLVKVDLYEGTTAANAVLKASDSVNIYAVQDGSDSITGFLTNAAHVVSADKDGNVSSFAGAGGTFRVFLGSTNITTSCTFSNPSSSGVTTSINSSTGVYSVSAMSADQGTATFQAVIPASLLPGTSDVTITADYSISKSKTGVDGAATTGDDAPQRYTFTLYYTAETLSSASAPTAPTITNYEFSSGTITGSNLTNWSTSAPTLSAFNSSDQALTWYAVTVVAVESLNNGVSTGDCDNSPGTGGSVSVFGPQAIQSFDGIVSFTNLETSNPGSTIINGDNITTGLISSNGGTYGTDQDGNFATSGTHVDLDSGRIRSPKFYIDGSGAKFEGTVSASSFIGTNTVGSTDGKIRVNGTGGAYIEINGNTEQLTVYDGTATRVILGKLS